MLEKSKYGFTIIEIMVVIAIIGILLTFLAPNVTKLVLPRRERELFISKLNALTRFAWQHALIERKAHKISVDFTKKVMWIEMATGVIKKDQPETVRLKGAYTPTALSIPKNIDIKGFIIEGFDEKSRYGGGRGTEESWFYIMPDGLTQAVTINFIDTKDRNPAGKPRQFGLVLNPFTAYFNAYDSFQK